MEKRLYMLLLGCKPHSRFTEQHDVFFGIGESLQDLIPSIIAFWPEAEGKIHIDAWRTVSNVNGYSIQIIPANDIQNIEKKDNRLFFLNLGGYKENDFEEYHYKMLVVAPDKATAISKAKQTAFFKHNASPHIDDKYGVDVDDIYEIDEILPASFKENYHIRIRESSIPTQEDTIHPEYIKLNRLKDL